MSYCNLPSCEYFKANHEYSKRIKGDRGSDELLHDIEIHTYVYYYYYYLYTWLCNYYYYY